MSTADIVAIAVGIGGLIATVLLGIQNNRIAERQNEIFREQNRIFAAQAGVKMPETLPKQNTLGLYWPTIATAFTAVIVGVIVSSLQGSLIFAGASSLAMLLAFGAMYWRERSVRSDTPQASQPISLPLLPGGTAKPQHNVQFVEFKQLTDEHFRAATLLFRNLPNGKLLGKFSSPRLRVIYYDHSTGQELEDFYAVHWVDEVEGIDEINAAGRSAVIAAFFDKWRVGGEDKPLPLSEQFFEGDYRPSDQRRSLELPFGEVRIVAILSNNYIDSPVLTVTGILTLGADGSASFSRDV